MSQTTRRFWRGIQAELTQPIRKTVTARAWKVEGNNVWINMSGKDLADPMPKLANVSVSVGQNVRIELEDNVAMIVGAY